MRKPIYIFFLAAALLVFEGCLKSGTQTPGPTGATGASGAPGGNLTGLSFPFQLNSLKMGNVASASLNYAFYRFPSYDSNTTYLLNVFVNRINTKEWYKLPMLDPYTTTGDEIYASIGHDTIKVWYYNSGASGWPADSEMNAELIVIPQQQQP